MAKEDGCVGVEESTAAFQDLHFVTTRFGGVGWRHEMTVGLAAPAPKGRIRVYRVDGGGEAGCACSRLHRLLENCPGTGCVENDSGSHVDACFAKTAIYIRTSDLLVAGVLKAKRDAASKRKSLSRLGDIIWIALAFTHSVRSPLDRLSAFEKLLVVCTNSFSGQGMRRVCPSFPPRSD
ncbi:hypothetical protein KCU62_g71, partial [Aureobasidium sp. EXF-3399]